MHFTYLQKAKIVLVLNFIALFCIIILTPFFIKNGTVLFSEEFVEGFFLTIELFALIIVFRHYDSQNKRYEDETTTLNTKLEKKEKELLNVLEYLGKVNVQVSMINSIFENMKVPSTRSQLMEEYSELLKIVCGITNEKYATLRIVNLENGRMLSEHIEKMGDISDEQAKLKIGNKELIEKFKKRDKNNEGELATFFSNVENFYVKAFITIPNTKRKNFQQEERAFLEAIANQCEIVFLLFNAKKHKDNNSVFKKG